MRICAAARILSTYRRSSMPYRTGYSTTACVAISLDVFDEPTGFSGRCRKSTATGGRDRVAPPILDLVARSPVEPWVLARVFGLPYARNSVVVPKPSLICLKIVSAAAALRHAVARSRGRGRPTTRRLRLERGKVRVRADCGCAENRLAGGVKGARGVSTFNADALERSPDLARLPSSSAALGHASVRAP